MNQSDKMNEINNLLSEIQQLLNQKSSDSDFSRLELDLMKQKTREFYDALLHLETDDEKKLALPNVEKTSKQASPPIDKTPKITNTITDEKNSYPEKDEALPSPKDESKPEPGQNTAEITPQPQNDFSSPKTTLDLFSEPPVASLGESLAENKQHALGDKLQQGSIHDLREAIGINDKFVFINELFNGDLEKYNKILDELNGFSSLKGAQTYLIELSIQHQWNEESPAFLKLAHLLERKFA